MFELNRPISKQSSSKTSSTPALEVELRATESYIQWRYKGFNKWNDLLSLKDIKGEPGALGKPGQPGVAGKDGKNGKDGKPGSNGKQGPQGPMGMPGLDGKDGKDGIDGREIELRTNDTYIQWRYVGDALWKNLYLLADLRGKDGKPGQKGEKGDKGDKGAPGYDGAQGPRGPQGFTGPAGPQGDPGAPGVGVNAGGTTGQVLAKASNDDYDTEWVDQTGGGGTPAGTDGSIQINQSGAFAAVADLTFDGNLNVPGNIKALGGGNLQLTGTVVEFLVDSGQSIILDAGNTSAPHTIYLPDDDGTLALEKPVYDFKDQELTNDYAYVGYEEPAGAWYIYRRTRAGNIREYATGTSDYTTNWTSRSSLTYS